MLDFELSEGERLEYYRRTDLASAAIRAAVRLFNDRTELEELIEGASKVTRSNWWWIVGGIGIALHHLFPGTAGDLGTFATVIAFVLWIMKSYELVQLTSKREACSERLGELAMVWNGATGNNAFWSVQTGLADCSGLIDQEGDGFRNWWKAESKYILARVCEGEKSAQILKSIGENRE